MFQKLAMIDIGANLFGASTAIAMAFHGSGYWALVARPILAAFFMAVGVWWSCRWWPGIPTLTTGVKEMLKFGIHITGFTMTDYVGRSADRVGLGYGYGPKALGFYQQAQVVYENTLGLLIVPLHGVAVAGLSKLRDNLDQLRKSWATALSTVAFFAMPAFGLLAVTGKDLLVVLLGAKWSDAATLLSILALRGPAHVVERTLGWLHVAAGRADRWMRWGVISSLVQLAALVCGLPFGPTGVAIAYAVSMYLLFVPAIAYAGRPLGIGASLVIRVVGPQLSGTWCSAALAFAFQHFLLDRASRTERILLSSLIYAVSYLLIVVWAWRVRKPLEVARSVVRDFRPRWLSRLTKPG